jgi:hypothetical protein
MSDLSTTLARIATHPMWMAYEEHPGDREAIVQAAQILRSLTTEWGVRSPEGVVVPKTEQFARRRYNQDREFWTLVSRQTAATEWEETE